MNFEPLSVTDEEPVLTGEIETSDEDKFELAAEAADDEAATAEVSAPKRRTPKMRPESEVTGPDPEVLGARIAEMIVAQQRQEAQRKMKRKQVPRSGDPDHEGERLPDNSEPPRVPLKLYSKRRRRDSTAIVDPDTNENLLKKGWVGRWVRQIDHRDRPTEQRMIEMEDYGYEVVKRSNGESLTSHLGIAMQAPPEQYALRCVEKSVPGAIHGQSQLLDDTQAAVESLNSMAGEEVVRFHQARDHHKETSQEKVFQRGSG